MTPLIVLPLDVGGTLDERAELVGGKVSAHRTQALFDYGKQLVRRVQRPARERSIRTTAIVTDRGVEQHTIHLGERILKSVAELGPGGVKPVGSR